MRPEEMVASLVAKGYIVTPPEAPAVRRTFVVTTDIQGDRRLGGGGPLGAAGLKHLIEAGLHLGYDATAYDHAWVGRVYEVAEARR